VICVNCIRPLRILGFRDVELLFDLVLGSLLDSWKFRNSGLLKLLNWEVFDLNRWCNRLLISTHWRLATYVSIQRFSSAIHLFYERIQILWCDFNVLVTQSTSIVIKLLLRFVFSLQTSQSSFLRLYKDFRVRIQVYLLPLNFVE
jgi:hypothetical protein